MGIRIMARGFDGDNLACLYDSTTDTAFGPVFYEFKKYERGDAERGKRGKLIALLDAGEVAALFTVWVREDARNFSDQELANKAHAFRAWLDSSTNALTARKVDVEYDTLEKFIQGDLELDGEREEAERG